MKQTLLLLTVFLLIAANVSYSGEKIGPRVENLPVYIGNEPLPDLPYYPSGPGGLITDSPGIIVGGTQYDYQSNGSTGRRIAIDSQDGVHIAWMNGLSYPSLRHVYYNYADNAGTWLAPGSGMGVSQSTGAGYTQISLTGDDRAVVAYHQWQSSPYAVVAIDAFSGFGIFNYYDAPDFINGVRCFWPYIAVDQNDNIHIVLNEQAQNAGDPHLLVYSNSTDNGDTWSSLVEVDTLMVLSPVVVSSPVSDKVAIVYTHPQNYDTQWNNDVMYIESPDGLTWDWRFGKINVTNYGAPDSLFAYSDLDAIYDYDDNLNIIWNSQWVTDEGIYYKTFLNHYNTGTGQITEMTSTPENWISGCDFGAWNRPVTKMSLAVSPYERISAVYTGFDTTDCSASGYANGDIYLQESEDFGQNWSSPINLTNTQTPGCAPGNCDSDHWASVADKGDNGVLHITYINDKDAGGIPQTEGVVTDNPVMYFKMEMQGVENDGAMPRSFRITQAYPNPFNAETQIRFELDTGTELELSIYDITGAKVMTLASGFYEPGIHSVKWDASEYASGVYFSGLKANGSSVMKKMTLMK